MMMRTPWQMALDEWQKEKVQSYLRNQKRLPKERDYSDESSGYIRTKKGCHENTQFGSLPSEQWENTVPFCRQETGNSRRQCNLDKVTLLVIRVSSSLQILSLILTQERQYPPIVPIR